MADREPPSSRQGPLHQIAGIGTRAAARTIRPFADVLLDGPQLENLLDDPHLHAAVRRALSGDGAKKLVGILFESDVFDEVVDRLIAHPALWRLVDEIAASPAVTAAITQQSLGFADLVGAEMRVRSRRADDWLDERARKLRGGKPETP